MPSYHLVLQSDDTPEPRRLDFQADGIDQAFQVARNRAQESGVELWEGSLCHIRMVNDGSHLWRLLGGRAESRGA